VREVDLAMDGDHAARRVGGRQGKPGESLGVGERSCDRKEGNGRK
jgi:hypothetical protein